VRFPWLLCASIAIGCGSSDKPEPARPAGGGASGERAAASGEGPLTDADCERLIDHWFELVIADKKATAKPEEVPTEEDIAKARARLQASAKENCVGQPRAPYDCAMKATAVASVNACLGEKP
jgi:hypothetical protein